MNNNLSSYNTESPLVSVIIPCFNAQQYIESAVRSIMEQSYRHIEIICINDNSVDSTLQILNKLAKEDSRIIVINNEFNHKLIATLNKGIEAAGGKYIARMDADDLSDPLRIEEQVALFSTDEDVDIIGIVPVLINRESKPLGRALEFNITEQTSINFVSMFNSPLAHPSIIIKAELLKQYKYNNNTNVFHVEDYDLWGRLILGGKKVAVINRPLFSYRINPAGVSFKNRTEQGHNHISIAQKLLKNSSYNNISDRYVGIISKYDIPESFSETWSVLNVFKSIKTHYIECHPDISVKAKREIYEWFSQRQLFIMFYALKKGSLTVKVSSFIFFLANLSYAFNRLTYINILTRIRLINSKL